MKQNRHADEVIPEVRYSFIVTDLSELAHEQTK
jgi:hypothetical protein